MNKLTFTSVYGDELRTVEIASPHGGGGSFHIMETKAGHEGMFLIGQVINTMYGWVVFSSNTDSFERSARDIELDIKFDRRSFTQDDKDAILDRMIQGGLISIDDPQNKR